METDIIYDKIQTMLHHIARENTDFICSCCLGIAEDLISLASYCCGTDAANILEDEFNEIREEE